MKEAALSLDAMQVEWMFKQPATLELTHNWCAFDVS